MLYWLRKHFSSGINIVFSIVVVLSILGVINYVAAFAILVLAALFYIEDHLRTLVILKKQETSGAKAFTS